MVRAIRHFSAFASITLKERLAYTGWFWSDLLGQVVLMIIAVSFWRAVYTVSPTVGGLGREQTVAYVLAANAVGLVVRWSLAWDLGVLVQQGKIAIELLRPVDFQLRMYASTFATQGATMAQHMVLLGALAWLFLGLQLPRNPAVWGWFLLSLVLGNAIQFAFDWILALSAFYTTEIRGVQIFRDGFASFFSGLLIPLAMLPVWLQRVAGALPFGQVLNTPVAIFTGMTPPEAAPRALLVQVAWLAGLLVVGRPLFRVAVRKVTVQGG